MQKIKLVDGTTFDIEDGASIGAVAVPIESAADIPGIMGAMTDANLAELAFLTEEGEVCGIYPHQHLNHATVLGSDLILSFRALDTTAQRLDELDAAVVELAELIAGEV